MSLFVCVSVCVCVFLKANQFIFLHFISVFSPLCCMYCFVRLSLVFVLISWSNVIFGNLIVDYFIVVGNLVSISPTSYVRIKCRFGSFFYVPVTEKSCWNTVRKKKFASKNVDEIDHWLLIIFSSLCHRPPN